MSPYTHLTSRTKEVPLFDLSGKEQAEEGLLNSASFEKGKQKCFGMVATLVSTWKVEASSSGVPG